MRLGEMLFEVTEEGGEKWGMRGEVKGERRIKLVEAGLELFHHIQLMDDAGLQRSGKLGLGGQSGKEEEGEKRCSRRVSSALRKDWGLGSADGFECFPPTEKSPGTNPLFPPLPLALLPLRLSLPGPPRCHQ